MFCFDFGPVAAWLSVIFICPSLPYLGFEISTCMFLEDIPAPSYNYVEIHGMESLQHRFGATYTDDISVDDTPYKEMRSFQTESKKDSTDICEPICICITPKKRCMDYTKDGDIPDLA